MKELVQQLIGPPGVILLGGVITLVGAFWASISSSTQQTTFQQQLAQKNQELADLAQENAQLNRDAVAAVSGGNGYIYLCCLPTHPPTKDKPPRRLFSKVGRFPLRNVTIQVSRTVSGDGIPESTVTQSYKLDDVRESISTFGDWDPVDGLTNKYNVMFQADNGIVVQTVEFKKNAEGLWLTKGKVSRWPDNSEPAPGEIAERSMGLDVLVEWDWTLDSCNTVNVKRMGQTKFLPPTGK